MLLPANSRSHLRRGKSPVRRSTSWQGFSKQAVSPRHALAQSEQPEALLALQGHMRRKPRLAQRLLWHLAHPQPCAPRRSPMFCFPLTWLEVAHENATEALAWRGAWPPWRSSAWPRTACSGCPCSGTSPLRHCACWEIAKVPLYLSGKSLVTMPLTEQKKRSSHPPSNSSIT